MLKQQLVKVRDCKNYLEVTVLIPWSHLNTNQWDIQLTPDETSKKRLAEAIHLSENLNIVQTFERLGSISKTAKACNLTYFVTREVLRQEAVRRRREQKEAMRNTAKQLFQQGKKPKEIGEILDRSPQTIRRWIKSSYGQDWCMSIC